MFKCNKLGISGFPDKNTRDTVLTKKQSGGDSASDRSVLFVVPRIGADEPSVSLPDQGGKLSLFFRNSFFLEIRELYPPP